MATLDQPASLRTAPGTAFKPATRKTRVAACRSRTTAPKPSMGLAASKFSDFAIARTAATVCPRRIGRQAVRGPAQVRAQHNRRSEAAIEEPEVVGPCPRGGGHACAHLPPIPLAAHIVHRILPLERKLATGVVSSQTLLPRARRRDCCGRKPAESRARKRVRFFLRAPIAPHDDERPSRQRQQGQRACGKKYRSRRCFRCAFGFAHMRHPGHLEVGLAQAVSMPSSLRNRRISNRRPHQQFAAELAALVQAEVAHGCSPMRIPSCPPR